MEPLTATFRNVSPLFLLLAILLRIIPLTSAQPASKAVDITMDKPVIAFDHRQLYLRCTLTLETANDPNIITKPFKITHPKRGECIVTDWHTDCGKVKSLRNQDCGCSNNYNNDGFQFRFYYFIEKINITTDKNARCHCKIAEEDFNGRIHVVHPTKSDMDHLFSCQKETVTLLWELNEGHEIEDYLQVVTVKLDGQDVTRFDKNKVTREFNQTVKIPRFAGRIELLASTGREIGVDVKDVTEKDSGKYKLHFEYEPPDQFVPVPQIRTATVTPAVPEKIADMFFVVRRAVTVTRPPTKDATVKLEYLVGESGADGLQAVIFTCREVGLAEDAVPPINISIYHGDKLLITRQGTPAVSYRLLISDFSVKSHCKYEGPSLDCIPLTDKRRQEDSLLVKKKTVKKEVSLSFNSVLYSISIIINIILLWWTIWILIHHVRLIIKRNKKLELYRAKLLLKHRADEMDQFD